MKTCLYVWLMHLSTWDMMYESVYSEKLSGAKDEELWSSVLNERRLLITQDLDFSDNRRFRPGSHYGIILLRLRSPGREALFRKVTELFQMEDAVKWEKCVVVVTDRKIRIHWPNSQLRT